MNSHWFEQDEVKSGNTHGTGCTLSSAITAFLASGMDTPSAVKSGIEYTHYLLKQCVCFKTGNGKGGLYHFYNCHQRLRTCVERLVLRVVS
ncbi:hydroxymethylpyrimidine/phosphomethylpyrimidine kinase [bacterium]|nr:hydroxymethylpyrimidine/phosphomethylpyrimidine kinase [bacterium]